MIWFISLHLINNFGQDLLNKNLVEPLINLGVHEVNHDLVVMVGEGDQKLWILNIESQILLLLDSGSQPEKEWYLKMSAAQILPQLEQLDKVGMAGGCNFNKYLTCCCCREHGGGWWHEKQSSALNPGCSLGQSLSQSAWRRWSAGQRSTQPGSRCTATVHPQPLQTNEPCMGEQSLQRKIWGRQLQ